MKDKIFKSISLIVILSVTGYLLSFAEEKVDPKKEIETLKKENTALAKELGQAKKLNKELESKAKELYLKKQDYDSMKRDFSNLNRAFDALNKGKETLKQENERWRSERAKLYEETGTAYVKAGLFDDAMDAYNKSLSYKPDNADVHYYLGLLYQKSRKDPQKAVAHFKRYLYLNPDADNKEEVRYFIKMLLNNR